MELNNYDIRNVECALSCAVSTAMPVFAGEHTILQKNAGGLVRTLQEAQSKRIGGPEDIMDVATYALKGVDRAKSELGALRRDVPQSLFNEYCEQLNVIRERFIPYARR